MKTMKQPRKDVLREQIALAADTIITLRAEAVRMRDELEHAQYWVRILSAPDPLPWWRRLLSWGRA